LAHYALAVNPGPDAQAMASAVIGRVIDGVKLHEDLVNIGRWRVSARDAVQRSPGAHRVPANQLMYALGQR